MLFGQERKTTPNCFHQQRRYRTCLKSPCTCPFHSIFSCLEHFLELLVPVPIYCQVRFFLFVSPLFRTFPTSLYHLQNKSHLCSHSSEFWDSKRKFLQHVSSFLFSQDFSLALMFSHTSKLLGPAVSRCYISLTVLRCLHLNHRLSRLRDSAFCVNLSGLNLEKET